MLALAMTAGANGPQPDAAQLDAAQPADRADPASGPMTAAPGAQESGVPPPDQRLRAIVMSAWDDSIATWKRIDADYATQISSITLRFVGHLRPDNCYGLYAGEGPVYCSGNQTVFVGTGGAARLLSRFGPQSEAGVAFLIGHEIGHHIQNLRGRFESLSYLLARFPGSRTDLMRRFELEADCFAGVWMHASQMWAQVDGARADVLTALRGIGDDGIFLGRPGEADSPLAVHGSSRQRMRWFLRGANGGDLDACDTFTAVRL
jgi:predicted metalloprotease